MYPIWATILPPRILSFGPPRRVPNPEGRRRLRCRDPNEGEELCDQGRYHNSEMVGMWSEGWTSGRRLLLGERCVAAWRLLGWVEETVVKSRRGTGKHVVDMDSKFHEQ
jgi:hypothetical protein